MAKILAIDDDDDILTILHIIFVEEGYDFVLMNTGATSEQIRILHPDLILLDMRIAGLDKSGDNICAQLKEQKDLATIPIILLSSTPELRWLTESYGADGLLTKPFDLHEVLRKVKQLIN